MPAISGGCPCPPISTSGVPCTEALRASGLPHGAAGSLDAELGVARNVGSCVPVPSGGGSGLPRGPRDMARDVTRGPGDDTRGAGLRDTLTPRALSAPCGNDLGVSSLGERPLCLGGGFTGRDQGPAKQGCDRSYSHGKRLVVHHTTAIPTHGTLAKQTSSCGNVEAPMKARLLDFSPATAPPTDTIAEAAMAIVATHALGKMSGYGVRDPSVPFASAACRASPGLYWFEAQANDHLTPTLNIASNRCRLEMQALWSASCARDRGSRARPAWTTAVPHPMAAGLRHPVERG